MVLEMALPAGFDSIEPERIAEFRREFSIQRLKYSREIQSLCSELGQVVSETELKQTKDRIIAVARERVEEVRLTYQRGKIDMVTKTLALSLGPPALAPSVASLLGIGIFGPAAVVAGISLFGATTLSDMATVDFERRKNPWSYVLDSSSLSTRPRSRGRVLRRFITTVGGGKSADELHREELKEQEVLRNREIRKEQKRQLKQAGRDKHLRKSD